MKIEKKTASLTLLFSAMTLTGCSTIQAVTNHKEMKVSSLQNESIFLNQVPLSEQTVHVSIHNASDKELSIVNRVKSSIESHGFKVVSNPNKAHYFLQANILKVGTMSASDGKEVLGQGYGSVISGVGTAAAVAALGGSSDAVMGAGLVVGLADMAASSFVKNINYSVVTDVQVSERVGHKVRESTKSNFSNGSNSYSTQNSESSSHFQRYRTRILTYAEKINLKFSEAKPELERSLSKVLSGIF